MPPAGDQGGGLTGQATFFHEIFSNLIFFTCESCFIYSFLSGTRNFYIHVCESMDSENVVENCSKICLKDS